MLEYALDKAPKKDHLHLIEHVQPGKPEEMDRMIELGVAGSVFINHVYYWGDRHERVFLEHERARRIESVEGSGG